MLLFYIACDKLNTIWNSAIKAIVCCICKHTLKYYSLTIVCTFGGKYCMFVKRLLAIILSLSLCLSVVPVTVFAESQKPDVGVSWSEDNSLSYGEIGGYLSGNIFTANSIFAHRKLTYNTDQAHGFAAEIANNLIDRVLGNNAVVVGDNYAAHGPDRLIIDRFGHRTYIQDKYYQNANKSVNAAFDGASGTYLYVDGKGKPMVLEVPKDQYDAAVKLMRDKISKGQVPGVNNPDEAVNLVREGHLTYKQAVNLTKAGNIDSLKFDAANGAVSSLSAVGISFVLDYVCYSLNDMAPKAALKNAALSSLKTGGVVFASSVITSQLARTGIKDAFVPTAEAIANALGKDVCEGIMTALKVPATGKAAIEGVSKVLSNQLLANTVLVVVLSAGDVVDIFRGRISKEELFKNLVVTGAAVGGGTLGAAGGAALGTMIAPGIGTIVGGILGSLAGGTAGAMGTEAIADLIYESDADKMFEIIQTQFAQLASDYLIDEKEGESIAKGLKGVLTESKLKDMFASSNRDAFAKDLMEPLFVKEVKSRDKISVPNSEVIRSEMKKDLKGVVFIH